MMRIFVSFLLLSVAWSCHVQAQTTISGALGGIITDQTGAVVPDVSIEIKDLTPFFVIVLSRAMINSFPLPESSGVRGSSCRNAKLRQWSSVAVTGLLNRLLASPNGGSSNKSS